MSYGLSMQASLWPSGDSVLGASDYQRQFARLRPALLELIKAQQLNTTLLESLCRAYIPLAAWIDRQHASPDPLILGINGAQGAGKSTLTAFLRLILSEIHGHRVAAFSIDDFYRTHAEREELARTVHPLLATRGVPGTHDVALGLSILKQLTEPRAATVAIPCFDKSSDDRLPSDQWQHINAPVDIVIFEGWCVGARPQDVQALETPLNELEASEDADQCWRHHVNAQLMGDYESWFAKLDRLIMLKVPDLASVYEWRSLQEDKLAATRTDRIMDSSGLKRFIMHYERLTRHMLDEMPRRADVVLFLDEHHQFTSIHVNH